MGKRGVSNVVAYVLLIVITISLSTMIYGWLKFYVDDVDAAKCPENVNLVISNYTCESDEISVTLKNKGLFGVDGFVMRAHDREGAEFGVYEVVSSDVEVEAGGVYHTSSYTFDSIEPGMATVTLIDVQPIMEIEGKDVFCDAYSSQVVECS